MRPCIFQKKDHKFSKEDSLIVVVAGCGQVGRGSCGGQRKALSTASELVRAPARTAHLPTASRRGSFRGRCAKPDTPFEADLPTANRLCHSLGVLSKSLDDYAP